MKHVEMKYAIRSGIIDQEIQIAFFGDEAKALEKHKIFLRRQNAARIFRVDDEVTDCSCSKQSAQIDQHSA